MAFHCKTTKDKLTYTSFSTSINPNIKKQLVSDAGPLLLAPESCRKIWEALQMSDYKKEGILNEQALEVLFNSQGPLLKDLLQVNSPEELLNLLDEEGLGYLDEDSQILIFSIIKERMQICAEELCKISEYSLNKDMLKAVRVLEKDILEYQKTLRKRICGREINSYEQIGDEKLEKFERHWKEVFEKFEENCEEKVMRLERKHEQEMDELNKANLYDTDFYK